MILKERIFRYLRNHANEWVAGGTIEKLVQAHTKHIASTASRRLRELHEEGQLDREMRYSGSLGNKKIAYYRYRPGESFEERTKHAIKYFDSLP